MLAIGRAVQQRVERRPPDLDGARRFLSDRLSGDESVVFAARLPGSDELAGFTQLYPTFSSVRLRRVWTLNDLFVAEAARGRRPDRATLDFFRFCHRLGAFAAGLRRVPRRFMPI